MTDLHNIEQQIDTVLSKRKRYADVYREGLRQKLKHMQNHAEGAIQYTADLIRICKADVSEELTELETFAQSLRLQIALFRREAGKTE